MARVLLIHADKSTLMMLETLARADHEVDIAKDLTDGVRRLRRDKPDIVVVGQNPRRQEATHLLTYMRQNTLETPVVVIANRGGLAHRLAVQKLGARGFLEAPVTREQLNTAIEAALAAAAQSLSGPPPITEEEADANLSVLERSLNQRMKCFAGRNQVYIQSIVVADFKSQPRICLKCSLRQEYGLDRHVYYEFIRDVCCGDPGQCEAVQQFRASRETA